MNNAIGLGDEDCGHLARIPLASRQPASSFFPLGARACAGAHSARGPAVPRRSESAYLLHQRFTACRYFKDDHYHRVIHPAHGLILRLTAEWVPRAKPRLVAPPPDDADGWHGRLVALELKTLAFHGLCRVDGQMRGYASFCRPRDRAGVSARSIEQNAGIDTGIWWHAPSPNEPSGRVFHPASLHRVSFGSPKVALSARAGSISGRPACSAQAFPQGGGKLHAFWNFTCKEEP